MGTHGRLGLAALFAVMVMTLGLFVYSSNTTAQQPAPVVLCPPGGPAPPSFPAAPYPPMLAPEMSAVTCFSGLDDAQALQRDMPVMGVIDTRFPQNQGGNWCAPMHHNEGAPPDQAWTPRNLGQVFGIALDDSEPPNIYVSTSTTYGTDRAELIGHPVKQPLDSPLFPHGSETLYRIDGQTGGICPMAVISDAGPGLGNVGYDPVTRSLFVTNFDNGLIQRYPVDGFDPATCAYTRDPSAEVFLYDHGTQGRPQMGLGPIADTPATAFTPLGRRVWAVSPHGGRLYYSVWWEDFGRRNPTEANEVWSVALTLTGAFDPATARRENLAGGVPPFPSEPFVTPAAQPDVPFSNPIADIEFASTGHMMLAERTMQDDVGPGKRDITGHDGHTARNLEYAVTAGPGAWVPSGRQFLIGTSSDPAGTNASGGISYDCGDNLWSTGHGLINEPGSRHPAVYGMQRSPAGGNGPDRDTIRGSGYFVDFDGISDVLTKGRIGAVVMYRKCDQPVTATPTVTVTPSHTPTPTSTDTPMPTVTPTPSVTSTPTITRTPSPTYTPSPTHTSTPTPTSTATPGPLVCPTTYLCDLARDKVPAADIDWALKNPQRIMGWNMLANPNEGPRWCNPNRCCLCLLDPNKPYSRTFNPLVWRMGCPGPGQPVSPSP